MALGLEKHWIKLYCRTNMAVRGGHVMKRSIGEEFKEQANKQLVHTVRSCVHTFSACRSLVVAASSVLVVASRA